MQLKERTIAKASSIKKWPASKIEQRAVADLLPYARNARTHTDTQVAQIAASIEEWGWTIPVLVDEKNLIIAGHGRVQAAQLLKIKKVPVMVAKGWSEGQKRAYSIADNKLALNAGWDNEMLSLEIADLSELDFDLELIGFDVDEINVLLPDFEGETDPDDVPGLPVNPVTRDGDVWLLGKHRLVCGDATQADTVEKCLNGVEPHLMVTDPPYGVEYDPEWRDIVEKDEGRWNKNNVTTWALGKVKNDDNADWREAYALFPGDVAYVWHAGNKANITADSLITCGFHIRAQIIWVKQSFVFSRGHYHWQHEPCWYAVRKGSSGQWTGDRKQSTVWEIRNNAAIGDTTKNEIATGHGTQKPVECMRRPIQNNSSVCQAVYDPFVGSGTTIIAAEMTGRSCHAIELSPEYVDVCVKRWQDFTSEEAVLEATGQTFEVEGDVRYDPDANSKGSHNVAIAALREAHEANSKDG